MSGYMGLLEDHICSLCRQLVDHTSTASELGYLNVPENTLIEIDEMRNYPPEKMVMITTGSQGESMAALSRMGCPLSARTG